MNGPLELLVFRARDGQRWRVRARGTGPDGQPVEVRRDAYDREEALRAAAAAFWDRVEAKRPA